MDKAEFVEKAPVYYALGIAISLTDFPNTALSTVAMSDKSLMMSGALQKQPLINAAINLLRPYGVVRTIDDDFGPTLYRASPNLQDWLEADAGAIFPVFQKFLEIGSNRDWLRDALRRVNSEYQRLAISTEDFEQLASEDEWEPIPLNRSDEKLKEATKAIDKAISTIEGDNGYAVHAPRERDLVVSRLKILSETLKTKSQIYWADVRTYALDPLGRTIKRFGPAAAGVAAIAARKAIIEWIKANYSKVLDWFN